MLSVTVSLLSPVAASNYSCDVAVRSSVFSTIVAAATGATYASAGSDGTCAHAASLRRALAARAAQSLPASCSVQQLARTSFSMLIVVPSGGSAAAAQTAIVSASYDSAAAALATATGCSATSFFFTAAAPAACGTADVGSLCDLPPTASPATANVGAIIGGVIGGVAVFVLFIAAVLIARGNCPCCGCACARRSPAVLEAMALPEKVAIAA